VNDLPEDFKERVGERWLSAFKGRGAIVKRTDVVPVEAIVRGYLSGSGWKSYTKNHTVCGIELPVVFVESDMIPKGPLFTPSTRLLQGSMMSHFLQEMIDHLARHYGITGDEAETRYARLFERNQ
jgi:phosphoribosylaminoimidazole-succinocarboxamide synthase